MPDIKIKIENLDAFLDGVRQSPQIMSRHLNQAIQKSALYFLGKSKDHIRRGTDMWKPPIDTGYMWNNIYTEVFALTANIYATAQYAIYVHEGTRYMKGRPFFEITARHEQQPISDIFNEELNDAMKEIVR
jgi:HK97 gp10 family phage protein